MDAKQVPQYAVFDDYAYTQRIAVAVRWFLIGTWLFLHNYRPDLDEAYFFINNGLAVALAVLNAYVTWRIWKGRPITRRYVLALSAMDLAAITVGIGVSTRFGNNSFVLYYPALLGLSMVFHSRRLSFSVVSLVAMAYVVISVAFDPGVSYASGQEKILIIRVASMYAVVGAASLMARIERNRRREAVEAERLQAERGLELQRRAQEAELAAQEERSRIAREIHDGIAQSIYMLGLHLETCADMAANAGEDLRERLAKLVEMSKQTLLEVRHYIFDLKPYLAGEKGVVDMVENQVREFNNVAGVPATLDTSGEPRLVPVPVATCLYRVTQEALANAFKHAQADRVVGLVLEFQPGLVQLTVEDDGKGFEVTNSNSGYGLHNMRQRAEELGGSFRLRSGPEAGTQIVIALPC